MTEWNLFKIWKESRSVVEQTGANLLATLISFVIGSVFLFLGAWYALLFIWFILIFVEIVLLAIWVWYGLYKHRKSKKFIVLMADIDGKEPQQYRVTEILQKHLREGLKKYDDIRIEFLGKPISEAQGSAKAITLGKAHQAAIVIWGWYGVTQSDTTISVNFEMLHPPSVFPEFFKSDLINQMKQLPRIEIDKFELQIKLSHKVTSLVLYTIGLIRYSAKDYDRTITYLSNALEQFGEYKSITEKWQIYTIRGFSYIAKKDFENGFADLGKAVEILPDDPKSYFNRAFVLYWRGIEADDHQRHKNTRNYFKQRHKERRDLLNKDYKGLISDPQTPLDTSKGDRRTSVLQFTGFEPFSTAGNNYFEKAILDLTQAIHLMKDQDHNLYDIRGQAYLHIGDNEHAILDFNQVIKSETDKAKGYAGRGEAFARKGDYAQAIADFSKAIELEPENEDNYIDRGLVQLRAKNDDQAVADFNRAIQLDPDNYLIYQYRATAYYLMGKHNEVIADYEKMKKLIKDPLLREMTKDALEVVRSNLEVKKIMERIEIGAKKAI